MINTQIFNQVVSEAKSKTRDARWLRQIDRAAAGILDGSVCVTLFCDGYALVTTPNNSYRVNGKCHCKAAQFGDAKCWHRVAKKLWERYEEACRAEEAARRCDAIIEDIKEIAASREEIIADIRARWPHNEFNLADELMARFKRNTLESLATDFLTAIQAVI